MHPTVHICRQMFKVGDDLSSFGKNHASSEHGETYAIERVYNDQAVESIKITDLNTDCLESILEHLNVKDLLNLADSNEWLRVIANSVFKRKYRMCMVCVFDIWFTECDNTPYVCPIRRDIIVRSPKTSLQLLRCFGQSISKLSIHFDGTTSKQRTQINRYVHEYCGKSLIQLEFYDAIKLQKSDIKRPMASIKSVRVADRNLGQHLLQFNEWFPNLRRLELIYNCINDTFAVAHFQHLEHLGIQIYKNHRKDVSTLESVAALLRLNPQIHSLDIHMGTQMTFNQFLSIICSNLSITKLSMFYGNELTTVIEYNEFNRLAKALPRLIELNLSYFRFSTEDIISCIKQLKTLKVLHINLVHSSQFDDLQMRLNGELNASIEGFGRFFTITL